jgi:hypothetical protein
METFPKSLRIVAESFPSDEAMAKNDGNERLNNRVQKQNMLILDIENLRWFREVIHLSYTSVQNPLEVFMTNKKRFLMITMGITLFAGFSDQSQAESYHYPELLVVPKASTTLKRESKLEKSNGLTKFLPIQISSLTTIAIGLQAKGAKAHPEDSAARSADRLNNLDNLGSAAVGVGGVFLGFSTLYGLMSTPYKDGYKQVAKIKGKSKSTFLQRERLAEEFLIDQGEFASNLSFLSMITNLIMNAQIAGEAKDK